MRRNLNNHAHFIILITYPSAMEEGQNCRGGVPDQLSQAIAKEGQKYSNVTFNIKQEQLFKNIRINVPFILKAVSGSLASCYARLDAAVVRLPS